MNVRPALSGGPINGMLAAGKAFRKIANRENHQPTDQLSTIEETTTSVGEFTNTNRKPNFNARVLCEMIGTNANPRTNFDRSSHRIHIHLHIQPF